MLRVCCPAHCGTRAAATRHTRSRASSFIQRPLPLFPAFPFPAAGAFPGEGVASAAAAAPAVAAALAAAAALATFGGGVEAQASSSARPSSSAAGAGAGAGLARARSDDGYVEGAAASMSPMSPAPSSTPSSTTSEVVAGGLNLRLLLMVFKVPPAPTIMRTVS